MNPVSLNLLPNSVSFISNFVFLSCFSPLLQLQKAIEGSTRSGVRLRPPLASFRDISKHKSVPKPPPPSSSAPSSPTATSPPSPQMIPEPPSSLTPSHLHHQNSDAPDHYEHETEVWIEGVPKEVQECSSSTCCSSSSTSSSRSRSCSYNSTLTFPPPSTPPLIPPSTTPPSLSSSIPLSNLRPSQRHLEVEEDSDDEPMV